MGFFWRQQEQFYYNSSVYGTITATAARWGSVLCVHLYGRELLLNMSRPHSATLCKQYRTKTLKTQTLTNE